MLRVLAASAIFYRFKYTYIRKFSVQLVYHKRILLDKISVVANYE